jgi:hypothetical protein
MANNNIPKATVSWVWSGHLPKVQEESRLREVQEESFREHFQVNVYMSSPIRLMPILIWDVGSYSDIPRENTFFHSFWSCL